MNNRLSGNSVGPNPAANPYASIGGPGPVGPGPVGPANPYASIGGGTVQQPDFLKAFIPAIYNMSVKDDVRLSFSADLNPLVEQEHSFHCRSFVATLFLIAGILVPIIIWYTDPLQMTPAIAIAIPIAGYILYLLIGCICNDLHQYLTNIEHGEQFNSEYDRVRALIGQFNFSCECYHYETRYHVRHVNRNGYSTTETYTTRDKVVTHTASQAIIPRETHDDSGQVDRIRAERNIVFMHFLVNYRFTDQYSRQKLDELFYMFKSANTRDAYQDFHMSYDVPGLIEKMTFYVGDLDCNYNCWFYFFTIIGLLWPYSVWVESKINRFEVAFMKTVCL